VSAEITSRKRCAAARAMYRVLRQRGRGRLEAFAFGLAYARDLEVNRARLLAALGDQANSPFPRRFAESDRDYFDRVMAEARRRQQ
jgi:hypothetical protein